VSEPHYSGQSVTLYQCDARSIPIPDGSVQCCVTSPPYWGLRDYGSDGQLGLEPTPEEYVSSMVDVFREVRRVLRDDGSVWLNLGDSYTSGGRTWRESDAKNSARAMDQRADTPPGLKPKDLVGIPWRVAFALQADGWYLRSDIIWAKPNPMPESVTDRPTKAHEYLFLLSKSARYHYDADAIREVQRCKPHAPGNKPRAGITKQAATDPSLDPGRVWAASGHRNKRSVWTVATQPYPGAHFAVFPPKLITPCILAGTSAHGCCSECGAPWVREVERGRGTRQPDGTPDGNWDTARGVPRYTAAKRFGENSARTTGWAPTCDHAAPAVPCTVLDPFVGSGTTAYVAKEHGRKAIGCDLSADYLELAAARLRQGVLAL